jgi:hypothetical protein
VDGSAPAEDAIGDEVGSVTTTMVRRPVLSWVTLWSERVVAPVDPVGVTGGGVGRSGAGVVGGGGAGYARHDVSHGP